MEPTELWEDAATQAKRKQRKVAWKDSYMRIYGMAPTQRQQDETGATIVTEVQCLFCASFGREQQPPAGDAAPADEVANEDARKRARKKSSNVKYFVTFRVDQFTQHLAREHPAKWAAYQEIRNNPDAAAAFFPEPAAPTSVYDESFFFKDMAPITYEATDGDVLSFREYCADEFILGKPMHEWCRFAMCFWHGFRTSESDATIRRPWNVLEDMLLQAKRRIDAAFEFMELLGLRLFAFQDTDLVPEGYEHHWDVVLPYLQAKMRDSSICCLYGAANLMANRRYMHGSATSPSLGVYLEAAAQVKRAMRLTHLLGGDNFVLWNGRDGLPSLVSTDLAKEDVHYAMFLRMVVEYKTSLGATFQLLLKPKPADPLQPAYDRDVATTLCFLLRHRLQTHFKICVAPTSSLGIDPMHEVAYASMTKCLGSIDCSMGDSYQVLSDAKHATQLMRTVIQQQGLAPGGLALDIRVRRESTSLKDLVVAHISAMDTLARGLRKAANMYLKGELDRKVQARYASWDCQLGRQIEGRDTTFEMLSTKSARHEPLASGELETFDLLFQRGLS
ncbi:hypothetical protein, variant [Saprolegnia diclina VS20]|uniref:Xylose isomerase n=1 Tax=Saprolegnia diclina (strain VS20) TaxID=1156394 RepID=T0Q2Y8_SAPDV|nr:hypothetical protein, variant [Saprolegnia diclina VS20]XP_008618700.1 hypothetical protein SDRG_14354 [Saprolegnia diclina VS20]EQC27769.1 hypothetical protein SDRG_14354 [Saprolegnia diclina VS20]EQC27770.1 hypothetical protein, variant [Saprolegnia diclina VS20]|eukprot:XP_008618699.1 hypothetical protein, variant [Saprolegnia diclina VS20]